ncbi:ABC transporter permease [Taklimakanibacter deserti]|uniref:ABC transporter permease n=1 Tax=Taklimakanibacter deserti TaxID=2267839 RepID=UPI000E6581B4
MRPDLWLTYAWRDLRSGLQGFWIFLTCLALGTAAIAIVGSLGAAIDRGLVEQGQPLLGGDVEVALIHREATPQELTFLASKGTVSKVGSLRAMARGNDMTALVEIKAIDDPYPLYGTLDLSPAGDLKSAVAGDGVAVDPVLLERLNLRLGDKVRIGDADFTIKATILKEPDRISDGLALGPRVMMSEASLAATGLIQPGSLITWKYRVKMADGTSLKEVREVVRQAQEDHRDSGWRVRNRGSAAPGADQYIERLSYFMTLVGLTALIIGGAGIANAASAFVNRRTAAIATLKCLGCTQRNITGIYLTEILLVALLAIAIGLAAGAVAPMIAKATIGDLIPLPLTAGVEGRPLLLAAVFGMLVALAFTMWPLARTRHVPASALFRHHVQAFAGWPGFGALITIALSLGLMAVLVYASFADARITTIYLSGLAGSFVVLLGLAAAIVHVTRKLPRPKSAIWRYALSNVHRPGSAAISVILALGLGLTLFVTLALTDRTISTELTSGIPDRAPSFFFLDIRNDEKQAFLDLVRKEPGVTAVETAPMLRGRITNLKGVTVEKVQASPDAAWALRGDRGLTYASDLPQGSTLTAGEWWPANYSGPPLVSFVDEVAKGLDLGLGDDITVNVLGRDVTAKIASLRKVNWRSLDINFLMIFTPDTLKQAPHQNIVTVEMAGGDEGKLLNAVSRAFPTVTAIRVKDVVATVTDLLTQMLAAIRGANALTLITGILVLAGALSAGLSGRLYDAVVLKTYGATRIELIQAFIIEYAILGLASAVFGITVGALGSWFLSFWILEMPWAFSWATAIVTALLAMALAIAAGLTVTWRALTAKPAPILRDE